MTSTIKDTVKIKQDIDFKYSVEMLFLLTYIRSLIISSTKASVSMSVIMSGKILESRPQWCSLYQIYFGISRTNLFVSKISAQIYLES